MAQDGSGAREGVISASANRREKLQQVLARVVQTLVAQYEPEKIILFGSLAKGEVYKWSDIDLAIIKDTDKRFLDRLKEVALLCRARVGIDYLVYTPAEFQQMQAEQNQFVLGEIIQRGVVLYERSAEPTMVAER